MQFEWETVRNEVFTYSRCFVPGKHASVAEFALGITKSEEALPVGETNSETVPWVPEYRLFNNMGDLVSDICILEQPVLCA